jgi:hypothetical protein
MRAKRLWVGAVIALAVSLVAVMGLSTTPSGAAGSTTPQLSPVCQTWNSFGDFSNPGTTPGTYQITDAALYTSDSVVVYAGDTLTLKVSAPRGTTGRLQIGNFDTGKILASTSVIPGYLTATIFNDSNHDAHFMTVTLETTQPGPVMVNVGCVGSCRVPDSSTLGATTPNLGALGCQAQVRGLVFPAHQTVSFTPKG